MSIEVLYISSEDKALFVFPVSQSDLFDSISTFAWVEQPKECGFIGNKLIHIEPCECDWNFEVGRNTHDEI